MKIGLFSDTHYCNADYIGNFRRPALSYGKTRDIMEAFKREWVDLVFCLGDMTDHDESSTKEDIIACFKELYELISSYDIPFCLVPGNHDYLVMSAQDIEKASKFIIPPHTIHTESCDFVVLDANYRSNMERFDTAGVEWTDSNLPPEQIEYLARELSVDIPHIVLVHECLDPYVEEHHIIKNAEQIRRIVSDSGTVKMVISGHFHEGSEHIIDSIPYITLPAVCENEQNLYRIIEV